MTNSVNLQAELILAHKEHDLVKLVHIYQGYGALQLEKKNVAAGCFYLANAYVYALEAGLLEAETIHTILKYHDREE